MLQTNFDKVKTDLDKAAKAYAYFTDLLQHDRVADDIKAGGKHLSKGMIANIESAFHDHIPSELLKLLLVIKFAGTGVLKTRTTKLHLDGKTLEGFDVIPALKVFDEQESELKHGFDRHVTDDFLVKLVENISYYRNILEKNLGELEVLFFPK